MQSKLSHVINIVFALAVVFGLVGSLVKPGSIYPATILVFIVLAWSASRIVREGAESVKTLIAPLLGSNDD